MHEVLSVNSHKGPYTATLENDLSVLQTLDQKNVHYLIDGNISRLYASKLDFLMSSPNTIIIEATEANKSIEKIIPVFEKLVENKIRRDHLLIGIGGGIIQDITCFIASTLMRGVMWKFVPTTLLAQADSCIGSKSSINLGASKNILGTFNPPHEIYICTQFLDTLEQKDIFSGIGEMLKVHAIDGRDSFDDISDQYDAMLKDRSVLLKYIYRSLLIKKDYIEKDEFDQTIRNIFNYGHSFGHAIESATNFAIPHGVAVTMGMNIANYVASARGITSQSNFTRMKDVLVKNSDVFTREYIPFEDMWSALKKDKKNTSEHIMLILPDGENAEIKKIGVPPGEELKQQCQDALNEAFS